MAERLSVFLGFLHQNAHGAGLWVSPGWSGGAGAACQQESSLNHGTLTSLEGG